MKALHAAAAALIALGALSAQANSNIAFTGSLGSKALLMINGSARTVAVGTSVDGVKLVSMAGGQAVIEVGGQRQTLVLGGSPVSVGGSSGGGSGSQIVLTAGSGGHFMTDGQINGRLVRFLVDTGATAVSMSSADAERIGLDYKRGQPVRMSTANGVIQGYSVMLNSVRVGDVEIYNVQATVATRDMPFVLLGNSFLSRFQMKRENDQLTLDKRF
jgi:aspartyl protease family protein